MTRLLEPRRSKSPSTSPRRRWRPRRASRSCTFGDAQRRPHLVPPARAPAFAPTLPVDDGDDALLGAPGGDGRYTRAELAAAAGVDDALVAQLESYGMLAPAREVDGAAWFDDEALEIVRISSGFFARGIEARHLRMYRNFADREAVLFGQVLLPYVRQRNPEARARLQEELGELAPGDCGARSLRDRVAACRPRVACATTSLARAEAE